MDQFTSSLAHSLRRFAMAGVGAITLTVDKSREIIDQLAAHGEVSATEKQAACNELHKRLTEQVSAFTRKLRSDCENLSFEQMLIRAEKLTPEQKQRLMEKLTAEPESAHAEPISPDAPEQTPSEPEQTAPPVTPA